MNVAYKHLDSKLRIAELTIGQWLCICLGLGIAIGWGMYVRPPIGTTLTAVTAVYLGALPAGAALLANASEFDLALIVRSAIGWRRSDGRYVPGPGTSARGYVLTQEHDPSNDANTRARESAPELDLASLWEDS